jgi:hypothetical protein
MEREYDMYIRSALRVGMRPVACLEMIQAVPPGRRRVFGGVPRVAPVAILTQPLRGAWGGADARGRLALTFDSAQGGLRGTRRWLQYGLYIRNVLHTDGWKDRVNRRKHGESCSIWRRSDKAGVAFADPAVRLSFAIRWVCSQLPISGWMGDLASIPGPRVRGTPSASSGQARGHPQLGLEISPGPGPRQFKSWTPKIRYKTNLGMDLREENLN